MFIALDTAKRCALQRSAMCFTFRSSGAAKMMDAEAINILLLWSKGHE